MTAKTIFWYGLSKVFLPPTLLFTAVSIACAELMDRFDDLSSGKRAVRTLDVGLAIAVAALPASGVWMLIR